MKLVEHRRLQVLAYELLDVLLMMPGLITSCSWVLLRWFVASSAACSRLGFHKGPWALPSTPEVMVELFVYPVVCKSD